MPDGAYFYIATVTQGAYQMTWDLSNQFWANHSVGYEGQTFAAFDPFNNQPMSVTYNFSKTARIRVVFRGSAYLEPNCYPPRFCFIEDRYEESGPHTFYWAGVDGTGALRRDFSVVVVASHRDNFAKNAVVVFGTKPGLVNVRVTPPVYGPALGSQAVSFDLSTYGGSPAAVTISFLNQASLSVLRTLTLPSVSAGHVEVPWDGRAENGMWVAAGAYTVTVTAQDTLGNQVSGQILTTIQY
jgi:hypothetical protein